MWGRNETIWNFSIPLRSKVDYRYTKNKTNSINNGNFNNIAKARWPKWSKRRQIFSHQKNTNTNRRECKRIQEMAFSRWASLKNDILTWWTVLGHLFELWYSYILHSNSYTTFFLPHELHEIWNTFTMTRRSSLFARTIFLFYFVFFGHFHFIVFHFSHLTITTIEVQRVNNGFTTLIAMLFLLIIGTELIVSLTIIMWFCRQKIYRSIRVWVEFIGLLSNLSRYNTGWRSAWC